VVGKAQPGLEGAVVEDVDDHAAGRILGQHQPRRLLAAQKRAGQVDGQHALPFLVAQVQEVGLFEHAGAVDQDVQPPEVLPDGVKQGADLGRIGLIGAEADRPHTIALDLADGLLGVGFGAVVVHHDVHPFGGQGQGDGLAHPVSSAGDQGNLIGQ